MAVGDTLVNASGSFSSTGGNNTVVGSSSGGNYVNTEDSNIILGATISGTANESNVLRIGSGTGNNDGQLNKAFISGINGISVVGTAVLVSSSNQLGILLSTQRVKDNIKDMGDYSSSILSLRPVTFTYNIGADQITPQPGLIAEEVETTMPDLVIKDVDNIPQTVKYHDLIPMLLNEIIKMSKLINDLRSRIKALE